MSLNPLENLQRVGNLFGAGYSGVESGIAGIAGTGLRAVGDAMPNRRDAEAQQRLSNQEWKTEVYKRARQELGPDVALKEEGSFEDTPEFAKIRKRIEKEVSADMQSVKRSRPATTSVSGPYRTELTKSSWSGCTYCDGRVGSGNRVGRR